MKTDPPDNIAPIKSMEERKVISMEDWVTIRNIKKKNQNIGTREIARMLGVSRNTVKRALASEEYPTYTRTGMVNEQIEPFAGFIKESYIVRRQKVSVIISNLRSKGFAGSAISVYRYIERQLKSERRYHPRGPLCPIPPSLASRCCTTATTLFWLGPALSSCMFIYCYAGTADTGYTAPVFP